MFLGDAGIPSGCVKMRVTVCELNDEQDRFSSDWKNLVRHVRQERSDLILLPEMAFFPWLFGRCKYEASLWQKAKEAHNDWIRRLAELSPARVLGTRPEDSGGRRVNRGFIWGLEEGYHPAHTKHYLPDEEGYWEGSWYSRGDGEFTAVECGTATVGFLICTDLWFFERSRQYGKQNVQILVCPRATPRSTLDKWLVAGRAASVVSGAYCLSSNRFAPKGHVSDLGGEGWITDPDGGVLGVTSQDFPFFTYDIDLKKADRAKITYPRYVPD
jgi:predicted amidohydrolase